METNAGAAGIDGMCPEGEDAVEWMLLTNLEVSDFEQAREKIYWYSLRWRIEMFFKVLKSGFRVEDCRLAHGERLCRYLTVMSVVAWRLFMMPFGRPNQSGPVLLKFTDTAGVADPAIKECACLQRCPCEQTTENEAGSCLDCKIGRPLRQEMRWTTWNDYIVERVEATC